MRVVFTALLLATFTFCTSAGAEKPKTSDAPVVTVGYLLYEPWGEKVTWESQFNSSLENVHRHAKRWLSREGISLELQTRNIKQVDQKMSSDLKSLKRERNGTLVDPFEALKYVKNNAKEISNRPDILCLVTQKPLTVYTDGFGSYRPLCKDLIPLILTYKQKDLKATGGELGLLIRDTLNINNLLTWYYLTPEEKKRRFE